MLKGKLRNILTGKVIAVKATTESVDSSYGLECWVDKDGNSYGQVQFGAPFGFVLISVTDTRERKEERS